MKKRRCGIEVIFWGIMRCLMVPPLYVLFCFVVDDLMELYIHPYDSFSQENLPITIFRWVAIFFLNCIWSPYLWEEREDLRDMIK